MFYNAGWDAQTITSIEQNMQANCGARYKSDWVELMNQLGLKGMPITPKKIDYQFIDKEIEFDLFRITFSGTSFRKMNS